MSRSMSVLHVEDDFADAMILQHALCDAGGFDIELEAARTLHDAKKRLEKRTYDLVIADLRLPDAIDPDDTVNVLARHAGDTPILVLTGSARVDAEKVGQHVTILDKNDFFHARDEAKSQLLLKKLRDAADDALMI